MAEERLKDTSRANRSASLGSWRTSFFGIFRATRVPSGARARWTWAVWPRPKSISSRKSLLVKAENLSRL